MDKQTKRNILITAAAILLVILLIVVAVSCSSQKEELPEETTIPTEETVEATDATEPEGTEEPTEPEETEAPTEPEAVEPEVTEAQQPDKTPAKPNNGGNKPAPKPQKPDKQPNNGGSKPAPQPPVVTVPPDPQPQPTQPPVTDPPAPEHKWQRVDHPEVGHWYSDVVCDCGARFKTVEEWQAHRNAIIDGPNPADAVLYHGGWRAIDEWIVDKPAYTEWVCSKCGAVSKTQP